MKFKKALKNLSLGGKVHFFGGVLLSLSVFLPWYSDIDKFQSGETYLGIGGPTYLFGLLILTLSLVSIGLVAMKISGKNLPKLPMDFGKFQVLTASVSLTLMLLAASVLFNKNFGINITQKSLGYGLGLGFVSSITMILAALMNLKNTVIAYGETEIENPLDSMDFTDRKPNYIITRESTVEEAILAHKQNNNEQ